MMQASTAVHPPIIENIPEQLTERPQWVCWRLEERDGVHRASSSQPRRAGSISSQRVPVA